MGSKRDTHVADLIAGWHREAHGALIRVRHHAELDWHPLHGRPDLPTIPLAVFQDNKLCLAVVILGDGMDNAIVTRIASEVGIPVLLFAPTALSYGASSIIGSIASALSARRREVGFLDGGSNAQRN